MLCLDLYAGTGALGFECISRGAAHVDFVESSHSHAGLIRKSAEELDCAENISVYENDVLDYFYTSMTREYDVILADPPYSYKLYKEFFEGIRNLKFTVLALEHSSAAHIDYKFNNYEMIERKSGSANFKIYIEE